MRNVTQRTYDVDSTGRRFLLHRPGDVITDEEAERVACLADAPPPAKPLDRMTLSELRAVADAESIDPDGMNTRDEYREKIEAGRAAAGPHIIRTHANERQNP